MAVVIPISGWVTERFGSRRTWIASIALFAFGSTLCALATSAGELIAFRVVQGLGGGMLVPVGFTLIAQSAGPKRVGQAFALAGVPIPSFSGPPCSARCWCCRSTTRSTAVRAL
jgi:MFS family permease